MSDMTADVGGEKPTAEQPGAKANVVSAKQKMLLGEDFPGLTADGAGWKKWAQAQIRVQEPIMRDKRLHWARHRHFWQGNHWISSRDGRTWRQADDEQQNVRMTLNIIGESLNFRLGIVQEQRPGFKTYPFGTGAEGRETAEAQQNVAEYYYHKLAGGKLLRDVEANNFTDGVAFLQVFVDKAAGPKREDVQLIPVDDPRFENLRAQGYETDAQGFVVLPLTEGGQTAPAGTAVRSFREGDIGSRVIMAHEAWFDPEAKTVNGPYDRAKWCILRRVRDLKTARLETGKPELESDSGTLAIGDPVLDSTDYPSGLPGGYKRGLPPFPTSRMRQREAGVFDYIIYIAPNEAAGVSKGLWRRVVGDVIVAQGDVLPGGKIPLARFTDGSADPEMFPRPNMSTWIPDNVAINGIVSKLMETMRNAPGRLIAQRGTVVKETFTTGIGSILEYIGAKPEVMQALRASPDQWSSLELFIKKLEDKTGWNDLARGKVSGEGGFQDVSGRALLGARELYERQFGPMIRAAAEGMSEWSVLINDYARYLFQTARLIPIAGRGDLAKKISAQDLGEESLTYCDAETMSPLPKALRSQMLFDLFDKGLISQATLKKRSPFAEIRDVEMGQTLQWDRAQFVNTAIEERFEELAVMGPMAYDPASGGLCVYWADDPTVHKAALEELLLDDRKPAAMRALASERWGIYDQLARAKGGTDPETGQPIPSSAAPPPQVMGIPPDIMQQFMMMLPPPGAPPDSGGPAPGGAGGGVPGASAMPVSGLPSSGPALSPATQQTYPPLGQFGQVEAQAMQEA